MRHFAVTAIGRDRPGIVAAIAGVLLEAQGNIEDSKMSILRGHFAVMLIVALPDDADRDDVARRLDAVRADLELEALALSPVDELPGRGPRATHVLSVYGADQPGIVHAVSTALAERGVSITDLETRLTESGEAPLYVMLMEVAAGDADPSELQGALERVAADAGLEVSLRELELDTL